MTTIGDIARLAGVAKSTVSRYLNDGSVSEATKRKIQHIIKETGYSPNAFAQSLKAKKPNIIGTIVPRLDSYASSRTLIGIDEELKTMNYQMLISHSNLDLEREIENIHSLVRQKVAGIILLATEITDRHLSKIKEVDIPVLIVGQQHKEIHSLIHNDYEAAYEVGKYILSQGHKRIAFLGVNEKNVAVGIDRKEGFKKSLEDIADIDVRFFEINRNNVEASSVVYDIMNTFCPSIIVCATDNLAIGAMKAVYSMGVSIPNDLSITGFGGYEMTEMIHPGLTTAKFFYEDAGNLAARKMLSLIRGEDTPLKTVSGFEIIYRESVRQV
ncbi:LacI family DNA-binding transcriptional regulator [Niallia sp. MER TA 168]|uniref:LacI family DNA-binding transcriptional regulator n=1 Tax=Niallia sp. MER TA 168 TaxID=2939568 RepID=UPI00204217E8|nr:LacI family DNA-binding transcriptional regulator [Niallia sp. MER TA 168]MCM3363782.1 LacI family DNA-binding transcriptional regulator [Niallia sp. MER TA 168]